MARAPVQAAGLTAAILRPILQRLDSAAYWLPSTETNFFDTTYSTFDLPFDEAVAALEQVLIRRALDAASGNRTEAALLLEINRRLLYSKMRDHDLD